MWGRRRDLAAPRNQTGGDYVFSPSSPRQVVRHGKEFVNAVSKASLHAEESHNTLKFASRAKCVRTVPLCQERSDPATLLKKYEAQIRDLKAQLARAEARRPPPAAPLLLGLAEAGGPPPASVTVSLASSPAALAALARADLGCRQASRQSSTQTSPLSVSLGRSDARSSPALEGAAGAAGAPPSPRSPLATYAAAAPAAAAVEEAEEAEEAGAAAADADTADAGAGRRLAAALAGRPIDRGRGSGG